MNLPTPPAGDNEAACLETGKPCNSPRESRVLPQALQVCQGCAVKEGVPVLVLAGGLQDSHPSSNIQLACGDAQKAWPASHPQIVAASVERPDTMCTDTQSRVLLPSEKKKKKKKRDITIQSLPFKMASNIEKRRENSYILGSLFYSKTFAICFTDMR